MEAESTLRMRDIAGIANRGREGLGLSHRQYFNKSCGKERRDLVLQEVRRKEDQQRGVRMAGRAMQGAWMRWQVPAKKVKHQDIWRMSEARMRFLIKAVHDMLPTPANKNRWYSTDENKCKLCNENASLRHILSSCRVALQQGRYTYRHNKVLKELAYWIEARRIEANRKTARKAGRIQFIKSGEKAKVKPHTAANSFLDGGKDWLMRVDLQNQLKFPEEIAVTAQRPDLIIYSQKAKRIGIIELTVPDEERIEVSSELKRSKYSDLADQCRENGYTATIWTVEVGTKGFPAASLGRLLKELGYAERKRKKVLEKISEVTIQASQILWYNASNEKWGRE